MLGRGWKGTLLEEVTFIGSRATRTPLDSVVGHMTHVVCETWTGTPAGGPGLLGQDLHVDAGNGHEDREAICLLFTFYRRCAARILETRYMIFVYYI